MIISAALPADDHVHPVCGPYVERFWLPSIGPTALLLARHIVTDLDHAYGGMIELDEFLICSRFAIPMHKFDKTIERLRRFHIMRPDQYGMSIRTLLPIVNDKCQQRWHPSIRAEHDALVNV